MAQILQLRRGTTAQNDAFTGAIAEVTVDTDRDSLRVHDGVTVGGKEIADLATAIPLLTDATTVGPADEFVVRQSGVVKRATSNEFLNGTGTVTATGSTTGRTLATRFADMINVKDFGAVGNGVADDTAAIQAAMQYAATNGVPLALASGGTYLVTPNIIKPSIPENSKLVVLGNNALIKQRVTSTTLAQSLPLIEIVSTSVGSSTTAIHVEALRFDGSVQTADWATDGSAGTSALWCAAADVNLQDCVAENFFKTLTFGFFHCRNTTVANCRGRRIGGHNIALNGNDSSGDALYFSQIREGAVLNITNCSFTGYPTTPSLGGYAHNLSRAGLVLEFTADTNPIYSVNVSNCYFNGYERTIHIEQASRGRLNMSNVVAENFYCFVYNYGSFESVQIDNCVSAPRVSGTTNGTAGFTAYYTDLAISSALPTFTKVANSIHFPINDTKLYGQFSNCDFVDVIQNPSSVVGEAAFDSCRFVNLNVGNSLNYYFFGDGYTNFNNCYFKGRPNTANAAIGFSGATSAAHLKFNGCLFENCGIFDFGHGSVSCDNSSIAYTTEDSFAATIAASDDFVTATGHNFINGDQVVFTVLTGGAGLSTNTAYFVVTPQTNKFKVSTTLNGSPIDITSDYTAATVQRANREIVSGGSPLYIRNSRIAAPATAWGNFVCASRALLVANSVIRNATIRTWFADPSIIGNTACEFASTATPAAAGFVDRFSDYVIYDNSTFVSPTATPITLAAADIRKSTRTIVNSVATLLADVPPIVGSATYDPSNLIDGAGATTTVTVTGAALGDYAEASFSLNLQGITVTAWVSAANTVSVRFQNETGGTVDLGSGTLRARVFKP